MQETPVATDKFLTHGSRLTSAMTLAGYRSVARKVVAMHTRMPVALHKRGRKINDINDINILRDPISPCAMRIGA